MLSFFIITFVFYYIVVVIIHHLWSYYYATGEVAASGDSSCQVLSIWKQAGCRHVHESPVCAV